jgi:hypothetical protein
LPAIVSIVAGVLGLVAGMGDLAWFILDVVAEKSAQRMNFWCPWIRTSI